MVRDYKSLSTSQVHEYFQMTYGDKVSDIVEGFVRCHFSVLSLDFLVDIVGVLTGTYLADLKLFQNVNPNNQHALGVREKVKDFLGDEEYDVKVHKLMGSISDKLVEYIKTIILHGGEPTEEVKNKLFKVFTSVNIFIENEYPDTFFSRYTMFFSTIKTSLANELEGGENRDEYKQFMEYLTSSILS